MKKWLKNSAGVTLLEGLIALLLLSVVATGTFGVLLSTSRKSNTTEMEAAMLTAMEQAKEAIRYHQVNATSTGGLSTYYPCGGSNIHDLSCFLPKMCDRNKSSFSYDLVSVEYAIKLPSGERDADFGTLFNSNKVSVPRLEFKISCNGYTL